MGRKLFIPKKMTVLKLKMKAEHGFTLIEMLLVLCIVSIISFIAIPGLYHVYKTEQTNQFFALMEADILYLQNQSLGSTLKNRILIEENRYTIYLGNNVPVIRDYPAHISTNRERRISFNNLGTYKDPMTFHFYDDDGDAYRVAFPLGKGRQHIEKP